MSDYKKKLIEVALPLEAINEGSKPETENPFLKRHPRAIHNWWARTPLSVCRAIIFAQIIDDPGEHFPPEEAAVERAKLLELVSRLSTWDATCDEEILSQARERIQRQVGARNLALWDPFAGRGSLPLEAQRLGLEPFASDLNPVAVLISKALIEIPPKFADRAPVNPDAGRATLKLQRWRGTQGLAEDVRYYGNWMRDEAERRIGHLYPKIEITPEMARERPDLEPLVGRKLTVIAWLWTRTVRSPNPAFANIDVPLASTFALSTKSGKQTYVEPVIENGGYRFTVKVGKPKDAERAKKGTKLSRGANFQCLMSETPIAPEYISAEANAGRLRARLMTTVAEGEHGRVYLAPTPELERIVLTGQPTWKPEMTMPENPRWFSPPLYGLKTYAELFSPRQLAALTTFSELVAEARAKALKDARRSGVSDDGVPLEQGGTGATAYADALAVYLSCAVSRLLDYHNSLCTWNPTNENVSHLFQRQAIPMAWDFSEANPIEGKLTLQTSAGWIVDALSSLPDLSAAEMLSRAEQLDICLSTPSLRTNPIVATDPPYYDNIGYADLSDFFYGWLRRMLSKTLPKLFSTIVTPKASELIASPYRFDGSVEAAREFFRKGFRTAFGKVHDVAHPDFPITVFYAFKQTEEKSEGDRVSTGWETMLEGLIDAGFRITGTLPVRTTKKARSVARDTNALASAIVIVCRKKGDNLSLATRRDFLLALKLDLPAALELLQQANIAPVDLAQSAIGPGMAVFSRYSRVIEADGSPMSVRTALGLINQALDEYLAEQESEYDAHTRWALAWYQQHGNREGKYGDAEVLATAKAVAVAGLVQDGILESRGGKVRLLRRDEYSDNWDPLQDDRLPVWELTHRLIRALLDEGSEEKAAEIVRKVGGLAETARDLAYRLYGMCERKGWAQDAVAYNSLVVAWPEIRKLAGRAPTATSGDLF